MLVTKQAVLRRFWYAVMPLVKLDDGPKPFTLLGENIVLWKMADGRPAAARDRCCHRTARLSKGYVEGDNIVCGYHGWQYDCTGACVKIPQFTGQAPGRPKADPAPSGSALAEGQSGGTTISEKIPSGARVDAYRCQEKFGYVWVALADPLLPLIDTPEEGDPAYRRVHQFDEEWKTGALRLMENSFDTAHFSFVHKGTFGQNNQPKPEFFEIRETDYGFEAEAVVPINNPPESHRITGSAEPTTKRHFHNQWHLPFFRRLGLVYPSGIHHTIFTCATPIDDERIQIIQWLYRNDTEEQCPAALLNEWDIKVVAEDKEILETVAPDAPCDVSLLREQHMPSDRPGIIMRKRLLALVREHGEQEVLSPV